MLLAIVVGVIYVQQAFRKIPIQYAKRVAGRAPTCWWTTNASYH